MSNPTPQQPRRELTSRPVSDRVSDRVARADAGLDRTRRTSRENPALWHVFRDLGELQRNRRRETGDPPSPVVRAAAHAFQRTPSMTTLTAVATLLDAQGLPV
jgi:hypothetical protein